MAVARKVKQAGGVSGASLQGNGAKKLTLTQRMNNAIRGKVQAEDGSWVNKDFWKKR